MTRPIRLFLAVSALLAFPTSAGPAPVASPDPEHRLLASLAGRWDIRQSLWTAPDRPPKIDGGSAELAMVLAGRHLRQTVLIADGSGFEGLGYLGYDPAARSFFSTWMDVNFSGLVVARGGWSTPARSITLRGSMAADGAPAAVPVREVLTIIDRDHLRYEFHETHHGKEALVVRLDYVRHP